MNTTWVKRSIGPGLVAAAMVLAGSGVAGASQARGAITPAIHYQTLWGWVNVTSATLGPYTPSAANRGNSSGQVNTVNLYSTGAYTITMPGIGVVGGLVHVSVIGGADRFCGIGGVIESIPDEVIDVECFDSSGSHAEANFTVSFLWTNMGTRPLGYLWADQPSHDYDTTSTDDQLFSHNSTPNTNHVTRTHPGVYRVIFRGLGAARGDVQVTPWYGGAVFAATQPALTQPVGDCTVASFGKVGRNEVVIVRCFNYNGLPQDMQFTASFMDKQGLKGPASGTVAYAWAAKATNASYTPASAYRYSSPVGAIHVTRQSVGKYSVKLSGMPHGGTVKVTTNASVPVRCTIRSLRTTGAPQVVKVNCGSYVGGPADSKFTLAYQK